MKRIPSITSIKLAYVAAFSLLAAATLAMLMLGMHSGADNTSAPSVMQTTKSKPTPPLAVVTNTKEVASIEASAKPSPALELISIGRNAAGRAFAMIRIHGAKPRGYAVGDTPLPGTRITKITATSIQLQTASSFNTMTVSGAQSPASLLTNTLPNDEPAPSVITLQADQRAPSSNGIERAIERSIAR